MPFANSAMAQARRGENAIVGSVVLRHRMSSRIIHWSTAVSFFVSLVSGLPIWTPVLGWMAQLLGGLSVCRWLHPWAGVAFFAASLAMFFRWFGEMRLLPHERDWLGPKALRYMRYELVDPYVGKYNGGQKLFFFAASLGALGLLVSGVLLWFPTSFGQIVRVAGILLHEATFILFCLAIVLHIYLATAAQPGTFRAMIRGTVSQTWAHAHHPRWYQEIVDGTRTE